MSFHAFYSSYEGEKCAFQASTNRPEGLHEGTGRSGVRNKATLEGTKKPTVAECKTGILNAMCNHHIPSIWNEGRKLPGAVQVNETRS
jgi:hypothetical protein